MSTVDSLKPREDIPTRNLKLLWETSGAFFARLRVSCIRLRASVVRL